MGGAEARGEIGLGDRVLRVLSHPIRIDVLRALCNRVASPKELAGELDEGLSTVSYHFKYLRLEDCVEIVGTAPRRGAIEHYYRAKPIPAHDQDGWSALPQVARAEISGMLIRDLVAEAVRALNAGSFDSRPDRRLEWRPMELDEEGWRELSERQAEWAEELERIEAESAERLEGEDAATGRRVVAAVTAFETAPGPGFG
jgi:DNA-binding transcriptional ArsR family regulator